MKRPTLIVFDLDGTLVDSRSDLAAAANAALEKLGLPRLPQEAIVRFVGDGIDALLRRCLTEVHLSRLETARDLFDAFYREHLLDRTRLLPGVRETLEALYGKCRLAVLTNKSEPYAKKILEGLKVAHFFETVAGEREGKVPKPDPKRLQGLIRDLRATPATTLMVGDGENDILVAKRVGCPSCAVADTGEKWRWLATFNPNFLIRRMEELPELFEEP